MRATAEAKVASERKLFSYEKLAQLCVHRHRVGIRLQLEKSSEAGLRIDGCLETKKPLRQTGLRLSERAAQAALRLAQ